MARLTTDTATALALGRRDRQEDAVVADFPQGNEVGFAVLSDGMGGHGSGDLASKVIVTEMFSEMLFSCASPETIRESAPEILRNAAGAANRKLRACTEDQPDHEGMGGTLITTVVMDDGLRWISVGDSPLYLFRSGELRRLNEDHSMAPRIDRLVTRGLMDAETAQSHPDRHCLTSALTGAEIDKIDCPEQVTTLEPGDVIVMASDGLQALPDNEIGAIIGRNSKRDSHAVANALLAAVADLDKPHQDNVSVVVIRMIPDRTADRGVGRSAQADYGKVGDTVRRGIFAPVRGLLSLTTRRQRA